MTTLAHEQLTAQKNFRKILPKRSLSGNKPGAFKHRDVAVALNLAYIQVNPYQLVCAVAIDIDHDNTPLQWSDSGLAMPNLIVLNPDNDRGHYVYLLAAPVAKSDAARQKPLGFLSDVSWNMAEILGGDHAYNNLVTKNPFCDRWRVMWCHDHRYTLAELAHSCGIANGQGRLLPRAMVNQHDGYGRNCGLFHTLRHWGYRHVVNYGDQPFSTWLAAVLGQGRAINRGFPVPLPDAEVRHTSKSISAYCRNKYRGDGKNRGIMRLDATDLSLTERRILGSEYAAATKRAATEDRITTAIGELTAAGKPVTKRGVSRLTGLSVQGIRKGYSHLFPTD